MNDVIENKKNQLNMEIRSLLLVIEIIDGKTQKYNNYEVNTLSQEKYLDEQIKLITEAKNRLINIFKD